MSATCDSVCPYTDVMVLGLPLLISVKWNTYLHARACMNVTNSVS